MVENNELKSEITMNSANVKLITDNKKLLEETTSSVSNSILSYSFTLINIIYIISLQPIRFL